jgi:MoaA/NifB/PqqE/SkfB family radical SAM enzyme
MTPPVRRRAVRALRDFTTTANRTALEMTFLRHERRVASGRRQWRMSPSGGRAYAESLLAAAAALDSGTVWHRELKPLRSYVDVSLQVKALRLFAASTTITSVVLEHFPDSRPALLLHAELLLERDEIDGALEVIDRALRVQAVCPTAQELLFRTYQRMRELGRTDARLAVLDYDLKDRFCALPFRHLSTGWNGSAHPCSCPAWVPYPIGNVLEAPSPDAIWNSPAAMEIRRSILDGDFSYCSRTLCSAITAQRLPLKGDVIAPQLRGYIENHVTSIEEPPYLVELNYDTTCNLACPSCRTEILAASAEEQDRYAAATERVILPLLKTATGTYISGSGEALASRHNRTILAALNRAEYPKLQVHLITNGQLLTAQRWQAFPNLPEFIGVLSVSIDAARAETYEVLRRPGKWEPLMRNLALIAEMRRAGRLALFWINFVVQRDNFREMPAFAQLGKELGVDRVWFQRVVNYGAYDATAFASIDVASPQHPDHAELLEILRDPILSGPAINRDMLIHLLPHVAVSEEWFDCLS